MAEKPKGTVKAAEGVAKTTVKAAEGAAKNTVKAAEEIFKIEKVNMKTKKRIRRLHLILVLLGILLVISLMIIFYLSVIDPYRNFVDCKTDKDCFYENFKACNQAQIYGGTMMILSGTPNNCEIFSRAMDVSELTMVCVVRGTDTFSANQINAYGLFENAESCDGSLADFYKNLEI